MLVEEFINAHIAATHTNLNFVLLDAYIDSFGAEVVDPLVISHKHHLQLVAIRIIVDKLSHALVNLIALNRHINCYSGLQINDVVFECLILYLKAAEVFKEIETCLI